jgi:Legionella pneumophila major outer membrane protein precursor
MWTGRLLSGVGLGLLLAACESANAQAPSVPPPPMPPAEARPLTADSTQVPTAQPLTPSPLPTFGPETNVNKVDGVVTTTSVSTEPAAVDGPGKWIFTGDYMYMRARRNANDFAVSASTNFAVPNGAIDSVDWAAQSAFRVGIGYEMGDGWEWRTEYTYFHSSGQNVVGLPAAGGSLYATLTRGGGIDDVTYAAATDNINYQVFDLEVSKTIKLDPKFDLDLFGGVRAALIDQTLNALYNGGSVGANNAIVNSPVYFRGAGLTLGGEGTYHFYKGFGLYGKMRCSLLSGEVKNELNETNDNGTVQVVAVTEKHEEVIPVAELGMGLSWEYEHVFVKVGYELTDWFNLINSPAFTDSTNIGLPTRRTSDLTLEAVTVQLGVTF